MGLLSAGLGVLGLAGSYFGAKKQKKEERRAEGRTEASRLEGRKSYLSEWKGGLDKYLKEYHGAVEKGQWTPEKRTGYMKGIGSLVGELIGGKKRRAVGTATETGRGGGFLGGLLRDLDKEGLKMKGQALSQTFMPIRAAQPSVGAFMPSASVFGGQDYAPRTSPSGQMFSGLGQLAGAGATMGMGKYFGMF